MDDLKKFSIKVVLITGFLGSGKTTFLNRVIAALPRDARLAALVNDFGEIAVDAAQLNRRDNLDVLEINKGSIFCVCAKKDFIRGLALVAERIAPDILLIEATGVANPSDIRRDLAMDIFKDRFEFVRQICLVDTANFEAVFHVYQAVEKQIATSDIFILNKWDLADTVQKEQTKKLIAALHPAPVFIEAVNAETPVHQVFDFARLHSAGHDGADMRPVPPGPIEKTLVSLHFGPAPGRLPPDRLASAVYLWKGRSRTELSAYLKKLPSAVLRAKGFVQVDGQVCLLDLVMGRHDIQPTGKALTAFPEALRNRIVFIAPPPALDALAQMTSPPLFVLQSKHAPL